MGVGRMERSLVLRIGAGVTAGSLVLGAVYFGWSRARAVRLAERERFIQVVASRGESRTRSDLAPQNTAPQSTAPQAAKPAPAAATAAPGASSGPNHLVQPGETLYRLAQLYRGNVEAIRQANGLTGDLIQPGQRLVIPGGKELQRVKVAQGDTLWELATRHGVDLENLLAANPGVDPGHLQIGQELVVPPEGARLKRIAGTAPTEEAESALAGVFAWPLFAPISSNFGPRWGRNHAGIDLAADHGDDIRASRDGRVVLSGTVSGYGETVILEHADGTRTLYAHASKLLVAAGEQVKQGELIALVGSTGNSTGPHLHFEIIVGDRPRDPLTYLPRR